MLMQILRCVHTTTRSCISSRSIGPEQNHLLEAARNLEERILPLSTMLELQRADNAAYQKQIASLEGKLKQTESLDGKVSRLRVRLGEAEKNYEEAEKNYETAASLAEKVAKRAAAKQDEIGRLKESLERHRHALKNKDEEVQRTKAALELKETQVWLPFCHLYISFAY